jgi:hypothetical protein
VYEGWEGTEEDEDGVGFEGSIPPFTLGSLAWGVLLPLGELLGDGEGAGEDKGWLFAGVEAGVLTGVELELVELELVELELEELELLLWRLLTPPLKIWFWAPSKKPHSFW